VTVERVECVVVGAGVVGLAVARALARAGREVLVVEAERAVGTGVTARSSEVVHAGLYCPPGSWKARLCVEGRERLYRYCGERGVACQRMGKGLVHLLGIESPGLTAALALADHAARLVDAPV